MLISQISIYIENKKGTLHALTKTLAENGIDILALSIADTLDFGIVRIIVRENDIEKCVNVAKNDGYVAKLNHIVCISVKNEAGGLSKALAVIEDNNLSVEYLYSLNYIIGNNALIAMRLKGDNLTTEEIVKILTDNGINSVNQEEINRL